MYGAWETGYYHKSGKQFGHMWNSLMGGRPEWTSDAITKVTTEEPAPVEKTAVVVEDTEDEMFPLSLFSAAALDQLYGQDYYEAIDDCLYHDEIEFGVYSALIENLKPYDEFNYQKYIRAIGVMDAYNWAECGKVAGLGEVLANQQAW